MIHLYSGTPGSGKSFHATEKIFYRLRMRKMLFVIILYRWIIAVTRR